MQISLLAVIPILCFTRCQSQETAENKEIIDKFRDLLYDETTLSPDYEDSTDTDMGVTRPSTTPPPSPSSLPVTTTEASSEEENLSVADLEVNSNVVQSLLEPRQLVLSPDLDYEAVLESEAEAKSVTFPEVETIQVISNPLPDLSLDVPDTFGALPDKTVEDTADNMDAVSSELDNIISDSEPGHAAESPAKWFYYSGHPGLMPHYFWPNTRAEQTNEIEDRVRITPQAMGYPYHYPYFHRGHHPYVYIYRSAGHV